MARIRVQNLAKELKVDVLQLMQHLKDDMGLQVNYLSTLDEGTASQVRQLLSQATAQVEELRIGENVKRRRRVAPVAPPPPTAPPEEVPPDTPTPTPEETPKVKKSRQTRARVVELPPKKKLTPARVKKTAPPAPPAEAAPPVPEAEPPTTAAEALPSETTAPVPPPPATKAPPTAVKRPKTRVKRKDTPARIISLPTEPPELEAPGTPPPSAAKMEFEARPKWEAAPAGGAQPVAPPKPDSKAKRKGKKVAVVEMPPKGKPVKKREVRERADLYSEGEGRRPGRRKGLKKIIKKMGKAELTVPKAIKRRVKVGESITVGELAKRMGIKSSEVIKQLLSMGVMANINYPIDYDSAVIVASEFGFEVERSGVQEEDLLALTTEEEGEAIPRPPVVTIMGHVDHGKTSLLDAIRESRIVAGEAGGITQHIGAYHVELPQGNVVFLDTPGHEAFTSMRARGAQVTDLVVLVVAADDGVMEQTQEAINHARAAGVPLVVAVNKIDKPNANPERVKRELAKVGVAPEDWGGDILFAEVSAKQLTGIDDLLEKILLQAEILDLKAPADILAQGRIIEARLDKGRGPVGTVLVQKGTLHPGDYFVCGPEHGRVRALFGDMGRPGRGGDPGAACRGPGLQRRTRSRGRIPGSRR